MHLVSQVLGYLSLEAVAAESSCRQLRLSIKPAEWLLHPNNWHTTALQNESQFTSRYGSRGLRHKFRQEYIRGCEIGGLIGRASRNYEQLAEGEVRLLELLLGPVNCLIDCLPHHGLLDILLRYEALLYTWGDDSDLVERTFVIPASFPLY
jgi:hypothetical protein